MPEVYVALGANLGQPSMQLQQALQALAALPATQVQAVSAFYRSAAIGPAGQPDYCNAVARVQTRHAPLAFLDALQAIEQAAGRVRDVRWAARTLDLDLLLHGDQTMQSPRLTLPHPGLAHRAFVLQPLAEIAPRLHIPGLGRVTDLLAALHSPPLPVWSS